MRKPHTRGEILIMCSYIGLPSASFAVLLSCPLCEWLCMILKFSKDVHVLLQCQTKNFIGF